jgi:hypothetical protein
MPVFEVHLFFFFFSSTIYTIENVAGF